MSTLDFAEAGRRNLVAAAAVTVATGARAAAQRVKSWHCRRTAFRQLQSMSDSQLKDVGIHRGQIEFLVRSLSVPWGRSQHADH